ncbi:hypothetical protein Tco_0365136 [Tanacetum coccineum]
MRTRSLSREQHSFLTEEPAVVIEPLRIRISISGRSSRTEPWLTLETMAQLLPSTHRGVGNFLDKMPAMFKKLIEASPQGYVYTRAKAVVPSALRQERPRFLLQLQLLAPVKAVELTAAAIYNQGWHGMLSISRFGDSINLNAIFSLGKRLSLPDLTPTCMDARTCGIDQFLTMELQRHLVKIGTSRALIDVHKGEIKTPLIGSEAITYNLESLLRDNPANYTHMRQTKLTSLIGLWDILSRDCLPFEYAIFGGGLGQQVARHYLLKELDVEEKIRLCKGAKVPQASSRLRSNINEEVPGIAWYLEYPKKGRNTVVVNENMTIFNDMVEEDDLEVFMETSRGSLGNFFPKLPLPFRPPCFKGVKTQL